MNLHSNLLHMSEKSPEPIEPEVAQTTSGRIEPEVAQTTSGRIEPEVPLGNTRPPKVGLQGGLLTPLLPTSPFSPTDSKGRNCQRVKKLAIATLVAALVVALQQAFDRLIKS